MRSVNSATVAPQHRNLTFLNTATDGFTVMQHKNNVNEGNAYRTSHVYYFDLSKTWHYSMWDLLIFIL